MLKKNNTNCGSGEKIVAYIYGELPLAERNRFEQHLLDCSACTDEFAAIADSRYAVYEWQKLEFEPMPTPHFAIPFAETKVSWFESIKGIFATGPRLATAGAFGLLIVAFGASAILLPGDSGQVAFVPPVENIEPVVATNDYTPANTSADKIVEPRSNETVEKTKPIRIANKRSSDPKKRVESPVRPNTFAVRPTPSRNIPVSSPRLNDFEDLSDNSLRLSDLVADIDTRD